MHRRHVPATLVLLGLAIGGVSLATGARAEDPPSADRIATAKAHLEEAYGTDSDAVMVEAIQEAAGIGDPQVSRVEGSERGTEAWRPVEGAFREWADRLLDFLDSHHP